MAEIVRVKIVLPSLKSIGSSITTICFIGYFVVLSPAIDASERERTTHAAVCKYKVGLHARLNGQDQYQDNKYDDGEYDDGEYDDGEAVNMSDITRMIAVPNSTAVEWVLGPKPLWWEIGSVSGWGDMSPEELEMRIREALEILSGPAEE